MWEIILLSALIQGLTEFLPVSSSGHLRLLQVFFGVEEPQTFVDICLHVGTLFAVIVYYRKSLGTLLQNFAQDSDGGESRKVVLYLFAGSVPTALIGMGMGDIFESSFSSLPWVGFWLCITGTMLLYARHIPEHSGSIGSLGLKGAVWIGVVQGFAVLRGISRSGSTIVAGMKWGLGREAAAEFSFLLSLPAIAGAVLLKGLEVIESGTPLAFAPGPVAAGILLSAGVGYFALGSLVWITREGNLHRFAPYCLTVGMIAIVAGLW